MVAYGIPLSGVVAAKKSDPPGTKKERFNVNKAANDGMTALHIASSLGNVEIVKILLRSSVIRVDEKNNKDRTALDIANISNMRVALDLAEEQGHTEIAKLLIAAGAREKPTAPAAPAAPVAPAAPAATTPPASTPAPEGEAKVAEAVPGEAPSAPPGAPIEGEGLFD